MTYADLGEEILKMNPKQLNQDVTIRDEGEYEYYGDVGFQINHYDTDVLDEGHPYLVLRK